MAGNAAYEQRFGRVFLIRAAGRPPEQILADYPYLEADDIAACLLYAARRLNHPNVAA